MRVPGAPDPRSLAPLASPSGLIDVAARSPAGAASPPRSRQLCAGQAAPSRRAGSGAASHPPPPPPFCTTCRGLQPTRLLPRSAAAPHAARECPRRSPSAAPPPPAAAPAPAGYATALGRACIGLLARAPLLSPSHLAPFRAKRCPGRTQHAPPPSPPRILRCPAAGGVIPRPGEQFSCRGRVSRRQSGEPTFQRRLLLFAPHLASRREPGRGAAALRLRLGSRPPLYSQRTPLPGRAARRQEGGGEGGEAGRRYR